MTSTNGKDMDRRQPGEFAIFEKHVWSIFAPVIVALLVWVGYSIAQNRQDLAVMSSQINAMQSQIAYLQTQLLEATSDRYRATDAARDLAVVKEAINHLTMEIKEIGKEQASRGPRIRRLEEELGTNRKQK